LTLTRRGGRVIEKADIADRIRDNRVQGRMTSIASNLQIDSARLWDTIHETAKFGATPKGGVRRLTLGPEDKQVRDWFRSACEAAGLAVHVDALGSMFALRKGRDMSKPPLGLGSHLDTQPTGGKFDGVLGTLAALEVVRTLNDAGIETETPLCVVNWTNEEGSRFAPAMMGSAAYVGDFTTENILERKDAEGVTVAQALDGIGYRGDELAGAQKLGAFVELHIEQGPRPRARPSAWSIPARASSGTTAASPASKATPVRRRCGCAATRWRRSRRSCWRWSGSLRKSAPRRSAPWAKP
jgi:Peptidase family M20/M25/M40